MQFATTFVTLFPCLEIGFLEERKRIPLCLKCGGTHSERASNLTILESLALTVILSE